MRSTQTFATLFIGAFFLWATTELYRFTRADIHASLATQALARSECSQASSHAERSIRFAPDDAEYHFLYGRCLYAQAKQADGISATLDLLKKAKAAFLRATELNPMEGNFWFDLAQTLWWLSRFDGYEDEQNQVESYFLKALETDTNNGKFLYALINYYLANPKTNEIQSFLKRLAMTIPSAYGTLKKDPAWAESLKEPFREGLRLATLNPLTSPYAFGILASIAAEEKNWGEAIARLKELIQSSPSAPFYGWYITLGQYHLQMENVAEAKKAFAEGIRLSTDRERVLQNLLWPCRQARAMNLYMDLCRQTAKFDPHIRGKLPLLLGNAYFYNDDLATAEQNFKEALHCRDTAEVRRRLAEVAMKRKDWDAAELESQRATVLEPRNSASHFLFAQTLQAQRKYGAALEAVNHAIENAQRPPPHYYSFQGHLFWALGDFNAALNAWQKAHALAPENREYRQQIAKAREKLGIKNVKDRGRYPGNPPLQ